MAWRWFKMQRVRLDLARKYHRKIERALSSLHAGQFLQIENQLMIVSDRTIAGYAKKIWKAAPCPVD